MMRLRFITRGHEVRQIDCNYFRFHMPDHIAIARDLDGKLYEIPHGSLVDAYWPREPEATT
jgi:hypothetical protein